MIPDRLRSGYDGGDGVQVEVKCVRGKFTREEVLGSQVADTQAQDGEFVQSGGDLLRERQQAGQTLQLPVQPVTVPFGRVGLCPFSRRLLHPNKRETERKSQETFQCLSSSFVC